MKINKEGLELVKEFEGLKLTAYLCPANVWTIGYGHTATARKGMTITAERAEELLRQDIERFEKAVSRLVKVPLNENQFAALVSFTFNLGEGALQRSTLLRKLNAGDYDSVPTELNRWNQAGGKVLNGLVRRRKAEGELFRKPVAASKAPVATPAPQQSKGLWDTVLELLGALGKK
jgi:lysozyme